jgi:hypothetical protein
MSFLFGGTPLDGYARDGRRTLNMGGGGSSGPSNTTTQTSNIPDWLRPQVEAAIGAGTQQVFNVDQSGNITGFAPYVPYSTRPQDYVAGFSPMQQQAFGSAANLQVPKQFTAASTMANQSGQGALGTTSQATGYGELGSRYGAVGARVGEGGLNYGQMGANYGQQGAGYGRAGANIGMGALGYGEAGADIGQQAVGAAQQGFGAQSAYQSQATNPYAVQAYMNPYVAASLEPQLKLMDQQLAQQQAANQAQAVGQGAYGGSRQAVMQGLTQQNADLAKQQLIAQGYNQAFQQAQQAQQFGAGLGIQGLQAGTGALQAGLAGQQVGLQGVQGALAGTAQGIQGAQAGMQGAQTGIQGINAALAGTAQGMQGAQVGLQGVQAAQAGYGLANQAAQNLAGIGTAQLGAQQNIIGLQNQLGGQQQQYQQSLINQAINNYAMAQQYPQQNLAFYNSLIRGYATPTVTTSNYQASPNPVSQLAGLGLTGAAAYGMMKKKGGVIKTGDGLEELGMYRAMKGK